MIEPKLVLSASSVNTFLRCGKQWEYAYVLNIKRPPNVRMLIGLAVHEAIETDMRSKMVTKENLPISDVLDAYSTAFNRDVVDVEPDPEEPIGPAKDSGASLVVLHRDAIGSHIVPTTVEEQVQFEVNGIPYSGYIDLVDDSNVVRDTKTSARKIDPEAHRLAMTGYAIGRRQLQGVEQDDFADYVVLDGLIRTKKPYYQPEELLIVDADVKRFASIVSVVNAAISEGTFVPNGLVSGMCGWCGFRDLCTAKRGA